MPYAIKPMLSSEDPMRQTNEVCVDDLRTGKRYVVTTQYVDFRPSHTPVVDGVARFTAEKHSSQQGGQHPTSHASVLP